MTEVEALQELVTLTRGMSVLLAICAASLLGPMLSDLFWRVLGFRQRELNKEYREAQDYLRRILHKQD